MASTPMASDKKFLELKSDSVKNDLDCEHSAPMETETMDEAEMRPLEMECQKSNPMNNDLIIDTIFQFCDASSLRNCRLVCSKWKDLSQKFWRSKAVIKLSNDCGGNIDFSQFLDLIDSNDDDDSYQLRKCPFKRYSIHFDGWGSDGVEFWNQKRVAVTIFNNRATYVKIRWECRYFTGFNEFLSILNSESLENLEVIWHSLMRDIPGTTQVLNCSNLKRLTLFARILYPNHSPERSLWRYLIKSFPNLEALTVGYAERNAYTDYSICLDDRLEIAKLLKSIRQSGTAEEKKKIPLKELEMIDVNTHQNILGFQLKEYEIITDLAECKFPLERLSIHAGWHGGVGDDIPIIPLLKSSKDTLQYLKASINFNKALFSDAYYDESDDEAEDGKGRLRSDLEPSKEGKKISLKLLKEVRLVNGLEWAMYLLAHLDTPNLEKLVVEYDKDRNPYHDDRYGLMAVLLSKEETFERLETFELHDNQIIPSPKMMRMFGRMMPNLVHLTIPLDKKTFRMICRQFKGLRTLDILEGQSDYVELDDEVLTGISKAKLELVEEGGALSRKPNITDLEQLSNLRICCQKQLAREDVKFTEHSVMYGFLQLPKLYHLSVAFNKLSIEMEKKLRSHVKGSVYFQTKVKPPRDSFGVEVTSEDRSSDSEDSGDSEDSESE